MAATQIGSDVTVGATCTVTMGTNATDYIIESCTEGGKEVDYEDVFDGNGALVDRVIYSKLPKLEVTMLCKSGADPIADFVPGTVIAGTTFMITSAPVTKSKSPWRVTVSAVNYGLAAV